MILQKNTLFTFLIFLFKMYKLDCLSSTNFYDSPSCPFIKIPSICSCQIAKNDLFLIKNERHSLLLLLCENLKDQLEFINILKNIKNQFDERYTLYGLQITNSSINSIPWNHLNQMQQLKFLTLSDNNISYIGKYNLELAKNLTSENLTELSVEIKNPSLDLYSLNLSNNRIKNIEKDAFHRFRLNDLDLSQNLIEVLDKDLFKSQTKLVKLSLASNSISHLEDLVFHDLYHLQVLNLSDNLLMELSPIVFLPLLNLQNLSLARNNLSHLQYIDFKVNTKLVAIDVKGNPWHCTNSLYWIQKLSSEARNAINFKEHMCAFPPEKRNQSLKDAYEIIQLEANIAECPTCQLCRCTIDHLKVVVDCKKRGLTSFPERLPGGTRKVHLEDNSLNSLSLHHVNMKEWKEVIYLHLDQNFIDSLKGIEGSPLVRSLAALTITRNRFSEIPIYLLEQFSNLSEIHLSKNPWKCNCNTVRFQTWLLNHFKQVRDIDGIRCLRDSDPVLNNKPIFRLLKSQLCPQPKELINYLDLANAIMAFFIVVILSKLGFDYYRQKTTGKLPVFWSFKLR